MVIDPVVRAEWIHDGVAVVEVHFWEQFPVALYLIEGQRRLLVDTGAADTPERALKPALAQLGRQLGDIDLILNTHTHGEHVSGNGAILAATSAEVLMHPAEIPLLNPLTSIETAIQYFSALGPFSDAEVAEQERHRQKAADAPPRAANPHTTVTEGDIVDLGHGVTLRVLHTPGHSPGSLCLYWDKEQILFSGDSIVGSADSQWFYYEDARTYRNTLERLQQLPVTLLCPAHRYSYLPPDGMVTHPARRDANARRFLADSLTTALAIEASAAEALQAHPNASRRDQAADALSRLTRRLGIEVPSSPPWAAKNIQIAAALWLRELSGQD